MEGAVPQVSWPGPVGAESEQSLRRSLLSTSEPGGLAVWVMSECEAHKHNADTSVAGHGPAEGMRIIPQGCCGPTMPGPTPTTTRSQLAQTAAGGAWCREAMQEMAETGWRLVVWITETRSPCAGMPE